MTTKRKSTQATSREGINFVRALVERHNCTFQEIDLHNDLGNDAYVEFVVKEYATGCCVALQIKSGSSYSRSLKKYAFQSDKDHFEYWSAHTLPVLAVIFDPGENRAVWVDITDYLWNHPAVVADGPYVLHADKELSDSSFSTFREHCLRHSDQYSREPNLGRAMESFATRTDVERCYDGLRALFAYHRQRSATWYYLISCLSNYRGHQVLPALVSRLCHVPGHGDIFWNTDNMIDEQTRIAARQFMRERFDQRDALTLLSAIDDSGVSRGTIGQCVHVLVDSMANTVSTMEAIASDQTQSERIRHSAILFAVSAAQSDSIENAQGVLERVLARTREMELVDVISWLRNELQKSGFVSIY